jgi:hypothetical protein
MPEEVVVEVYRCPQLLGVEAAELSVVLIASMVALEV